MKFLFVVSMVLVGLTAFFAIQNAQVTRVSFFLWYVEAPLAILLTGTFVAGVAAAWLTLLPGSIRKSLEISKLRKREPASSHTSVPAPAPTAAAAPPPSSGKVEEGATKP